MCLGVPARVISTGDTTSPMPMGEIDIKGERRPCCFAYTPDARPGDWVLIQTGFAMQLLDDDSAQAALATIDEFNLLPSQHEPPLHR
ncbi:HypC/HybG/HupF family hydrogenase formation chaperone [Corynebacterium breve]|uniref:HypC/HybG/HupF family hydrogenase formation chaperone n=1 Tax=Corynebacterium breve TaxID=3049799 RepID=A0ABY8VFM7_9CORY|nr:HypC/HybG/HupF family hydrogenase formation chaperone [Corynebacterium breve]WIM68279.1 HypC/HybG/HupF family hydrogenase formation chaperone [Corynebacterium breve]